MIAFLWPSYDNLVKYTWDEGNQDWAAAYARGLLAEAVQLSDDITIVAHSMGNRLLLDAVRDLWRSRPTYAYKIKRIVIASPDTDRAVLERDLLEIKDTDIPVTVYASERDTPLQYSWRVHGLARGGDLSRKLRNTFLFPSRNPIYPDFANSGVELVDTTEVRRGLGHADFVESEEGASDLCRVLNGDATGPGRKNVGTSRTWELIEKPVANDDCATAGRTTAPWVRE